MSHHATRPQTWVPWAALVVVYVVWGSTYLAIRVGVQTLPPFLLAGVRYLVAGALLYPVAVRMGGPNCAEPTGPEEGSGSAPPSSAPCC